MCSHDIPRITVPGTTLEGGYFKAYSRPGSRSPAGFQMRRGRHWQPTRIVRPPPPRTAPPAREIMDHWHILSGH